MGVQAIKILVVGGRNVGKRAFMRTISEVDGMSLSNPPQRPSPPPPEDSSTIEFGRITVDDDCVLYLFGFDLFVLSRLSGDETLVQGCAGFCMLIDSCDEHSFYEAQALLKYLTLSDPVPYIVVANKQDCEDAMTVGQIRREMDLPAETLILPCVATERASVANVLNTLLPMIRPDLQERIR